MKKLLVFGLILAAAGVPVYLRATAPPFGVGPEHPLGDAAEIEAWLLGRGFGRGPIQAPGRKEERQLDEPAPQSEEAFVTPPGAQYDDLDRASYEEWPYRIRVHVAAGVVRRLTGNFYSGDDRLRLPRSAAESLIGQIWVAAAGAPPSFRLVRIGEGRKAVLYLVAEFERGGVRGRWQKRYYRNDDKRSCHDVVRLTRS